MSAQDGDGPLRVAVLADTHMRRGGRDLPERAWEVVTGSGLVLHAGDVVDADLLARLGEIAPVERCSATTTMH